MLEVDGSAGGGQLVRTSLTLSMLTGEAVRIEDVRGNRSNPGLKAQHLTVVETAARVCDADVDGAELGAQRVKFDPGTPTGGAYEAAIGTAGSIALLFDTFLPLATVLDEPLTVRATGGTDVKWSPPAAFYRRVKLPLLRDYGIAAAVDVDRTGFYPQGGGTATLRLWPSTVAPLELSDPGHVTGARVYSKASEDLADADVAERQASAAVDGLERLDVDVSESRVASVASASTGSVVVVRVDREGGVGGFDAFGERGTPAEDVAESALDGVARFSESGAAVDEHLADQLLVFLALVGGKVAIPHLTDHVESSLGVLDTFGYDVVAEKWEDSVLLRGTRTGRR